MTGLFQYLTIGTASTAGVWILSAVEGRSSFLWGVLLIAAAWVFMKLQENQVEKKARESFTNSQRIDSK